MTQSLQQTGIAYAFQCLGDKCPDTCCKGWGMQVDTVTIERYREQAPELLDAVTSGEAEHIMRRDPSTDYCVKFENGLCGIHKRRGTDFLGDACHFYPRVTRKVGQPALMTAALSCPEVARLALSLDAPFANHHVEADRLPNSMKQYAQSPEQGGAMLSIHAICLDAVAAEDVPAAQALARLQEAMLGLERQPQEQWPAALPFYLKMADGRMAAPEPHEDDLILLLNALIGLVGAARSSPRERLMDMIGMMEAALNVAIDWERLVLLLQPDSRQRAARLMQAWRGEGEKALRPLLQRWLQAQLSIGFFPYSGLGDTPVQRLAIIGVRLATLQLACMAHHARHGVWPTQAELIELIQPLSRFLDHLADPELSLKIYEETGWLLGPRLRGLLGNTAAGQAPMPVA